MFGNLYSALTMCSIKHQRDQRILPVERQSLNLVWKLIIVPVLLLLSRLRKNKYALFTVFLEGLWAFGDKNSNFSLFLSIHAFFWWVCGDLLRL